jgi:hypothetical protein
VAGCHKKRDAAKNDKTRAGIIAISTTVDLAAKANNNSD